MKHKKRFIHKAQIIFIIVGLIWCSFVFNYLTVSGWWAGRANLSPMELMGGLSGLFLPLVVLFLISAYFDRNEYLEKQGRHLRQYLEELIYPTEEGVCRLRYPRYAPYKYPERRQARDEGYCRQAPRCP